MPNNNDKKNFGVPKNPVKVVQINMTPVFVVIGLILFLTFALNFFSRASEATEINTTKLLENLNNNQYSSLDIRDDGRVIATSKYIIGAQVDKSIQFDSSKQLVPIQDYDEISEADLYEMIRPLNFQEQIDLVTNRSSLRRAEALFIADDFVIVDVFRSTKPAIVKGYGQDKFKKLIEQKGISKQIFIPVDYLYVATAITDLNNFNNYLNESKLSVAYQYDDIVFGVLKREFVKQDFIYWRPLGPSFTDFLQQEGINFSEIATDVKSSVVLQVQWGDIITIAVLLGGFAFLVLVMLRGVQGGGNSLMKFGQSKARMVFGRKPDITFKDVAGVDEAKEELREVVLFLKDPKRFLKMGARIPKGMLMVGAPGTGKTLLARAVAGEAGVPFFHTSGSEFEEMLVGAGASRVRDLFDKAKRAAPSIIFIDEIDAVARKRGTTVQSSTTEQTLNQILVEMDGFEKNTNVIVMAATNRPDVLDPAILRPGRFDRRVVLDVPDIEGRKQIIALHSANKPIAKDVDFEKLAKRTVGYSGADIENMLNEAAIIVAKDNRSEITFNDLEEAANKVQIGPAKKRKRSQKELEMTAYHEAGHALVMKMTPEHDPVHRVTIVSRGMALGYTMPLPETDEVQMSKTKMLSKIKSLVAGYATEELVFGDVTSGASNDIEKATSIARRMVKHFGMSKRLGLVKYGEENELQYLGYGYGEQRDYSDETAKIIDEEVRQIIDDCFKEAKKIISENRAILDKVVKVLLEKEVLDAEEFNAFFDKK